MEASSRPTALASISQAKQLLAKADIYEAIDLRDKAAAVAEHIERDQLGRERMRVRVRGGRVITQEPRTTRGIVDRPPLSMMRWRRPWIER